MTTRLRKFSLPGIILLAVLITSFLFLTQPGESANQASGRRVCRSDSYPAYPGTGYPAVTQVSCAFLPVVLNGRTMLTPTRTPTPTLTPTPTRTPSPTPRAYP